MKPTAYDFVLAQILALSNLDRINDAQEMQDSLEKIHELINNNFPHIKETEDGI